MGGLYYKVHGLRLAQASEMQLDLKADRPHGMGRPAKIHMQLDGEPWQQELPCEEAEPPLHVSSSLGLGMQCVPTGKSAAHVPSDSPRDELAATLQTCSLSCWGGLGQLQTLINAIQAWTARLSICSCQQTLLLVLTLALS